MVIKCEGSFRVLLNDYVVCNTDWGIDDGDDYASINSSIQPYFAAYPGPNGKQGSLDVPLPSDDSLAIRSVE